MQMCTRKNKFLEIKVPGRRLTAPITIAVEHTLYVSSPNLDD